VNESVDIESSQHLVGTVNISGVQEPLRITISYLDPAISADSLIPLLADLDLIIISPSGRIFRGNHYLDGSEEHFSTTERVILNSNEVEIGEYQIHIISTFASIIKSCRFSIIVSGVIANARDYLLFVKATECLPCGSGICDQRTFICNCNSVDRFGQSCQIAIQPIEAQANPTKQRFTVQPLESLYLKFTKPSTAENDLLIGISGDDPIVLRILIAEDRWPNGIPFNYDRVIWDNHTVRGYWEETTRASVVHALVRNEYSTPWGFQVWAKADIPIPNPSNSPEVQLSNNSTLVIKIVVPIVVVIVIVIVIMAIFFVWRKRRLASREPLNDSDTFYSPNV
jgi:hypothetical protein